MRTRAATSWSPCTRSRGGHPGDGGMIGFDHDDTAISRSSYGSSRTRRIPISMTGCSTPFQDGRSTRGWKAGRLVAELGGRPVRLHQHHPHRHVAPAAFTKAIVSCSPSCTANATRTRAIGLILRRGDWNQAVAPSGRSQAGAAHPLELRGARLAQRAWLTLSMVVETALAAARRRARGSHPRPDAQAPVGVVRDTSEGLDASSPSYRDNRPPVSSRPPSPRSRPDSSGKFQSAARIEARTGFPGTRPALGFGALLGPDFNEADVVDTLVEGFAAGAPSWGSARRAWCAAPRSSGLPPPGE